MNACHIQVVPVEPEASTRFHFTRIWQRYAACACAKTVEARDRDQPSDLAKYLRAWPFPSRNVWLCWAERKFISGTVSLLYRVSGKQLGNLTVLNDICHNYRYSSWLRYHSSYQPDFTSECCIPYLIPLLVADLLYSEFPDACSVTGLYTAILLNQDHIRIQSILTHSSCCCLNTVISPETESVILEHPERDPQTSRKQI